MKPLTIIVTISLLLILALAVAPGVYFHLSRIAENTADINRLRAEVRILQQKLTSGINRNRAAIRVLQEQKFTIRICPDKFGRFDFQIEEVK